MHGKRVTSFATVFLAASLPIAGPLLAQNPPAAPPPATHSGDLDQTPNQAEVKTFSGKISKNNGMYVLEDSTANTAFALDDQKTAKKYEGKAVLVTGTLDSSSNTIHVQKIEAAA